MAIEEQSWQDELRANLQGLKKIVATTTTWALATCKNEIQLLPGFFKHHRDLGVENFLIVDDSSEDGSFEYLQDQGDAIVIRINAPYPRFKSEFRSIICDELFEDKWVLFLDIDERLVYNDFERVRIDDFLSGLEQSGAAAAVGLMIDCYRPEGAGTADFDAPLSDQGLWFDSNTYRAVYTNSATQNQWPTPRVDYFGGAQERLFFESPFTTGTWLDRLISRVSLNTIGRPNSNPSTVIDGLRHWISRRLKKFAQGTPTPPKQNKIPILKWERGIQFSGGVHRINRVVGLAEKRVCLLHLKFNEDFRQRVSKIAQTGTHANSSEVYSHILKSLSLMKESDPNPFFPSSKRFEGSKSINKSRLFG